MSKLHVSFAVAALAAFAPAVGAQSLSTTFGTSPRASAVRAAGPTVEQFMSPPSPLEVSAARKADKVAWVTYDRGLRNVYVASAPDFKAVKLTNFNDDNGIDL